MKYSPNYDYQFNSQSKFLNTIPKTNTHSRCKKPAFCYSVDTPM